MWTEDKIARLTSLWSEGSTASDIAGEIGVSRSAVLGKIGRLGLQRRETVTTSRKHDRAERESVVTQMWLAGESSRAIAKEVGYSEAGVQQLARRLGLPHRPRGPKRKMPLEQRVDPVSFDRLANKIVTPGIEKHLVPLLHFRGNADIGRIHRLWNLTLAMKETGIETTADAKALANHPQFAHICEPIRPKDPMSLVSFFSRLEAKPSVAALEPGLLDYIRGIGKWRFELTPVSEVAHHRGHAWWREYAPRDLTPEQLAARQTAKLRPRATELMWPYIAHDPKKTSVGGTDIVAMVNGIVSKAIPEENRADICQDLILAVLEGRFSVDDIRDNPRKHISLVRDKSPWKYEWVSLDAPLYGDDGLTLGETLSS